MEFLSPSPGKTRKRARAESYIADAKLTLLDADATPDKAVRDAEYYLHDGDCVIRVGDALFKKMFALLLGTQTPQGSSDDNPLTLTGDTVEEFRALFWALYALPEEIAKESTTENSMARLTCVAAISHKCQLEAF
ncbi:hypothetical protein B0H10DRAFT_2218094 [Mycena sp. CBHHK59/15]|nr:hypothetical protein B0H10DRAFT_2218094 [Mycena sp. CBHHK59/15]